MKITEEFAEFYGALLGDGCLTRYIRKDRNTFVHCIKLTGHSHDRRYYEEIIKPVVNSAFGVDGYLKNRPKYNAIIYDIINKPAFEFLNKMGMPIGIKKELEIPIEIRKNNNLSIACVRGLFNTDGSIYRRYNKKYNGHTKLYNQLVIQFKLNSITLLKQIKIILESHKIRTNNITKSGNAFALRITYQPAVKTFMELINTKHTYYAERYLNLQKEPISNGLVAQPG